MEVSVHVVTHVVEPDVTADDHSVIHTVQVDAPEEYVISLVVWPSREADGSDESVEVSVQVVAQVFEPDLTPEDHSVRQTVHVDDPAASVRSLVVCPSKEAAGESEL